MPAILKKPHLTFRGIVLAAHPSQDRDLMLSVLAERVGKISLLHRGGRNPKKGKVRLEIFDVGTFSVRTYPGSHVGALSDFIPERSFGPLRDRLFRLLPAALLLEVLSLLVPEEDPESGALLESTLHALHTLCLSASARDALQVLYRALVDLLGLLGYVDAERTAQPSSHGLLRLIALVEQTAGRRLVTAQEVIGLCEELRVG